MSLKFVLDLLGFVRTNGTARKRLVLPLEIIKHTKSKSAVLVTFQHLKVLSASTHELSLPVKMQRTDQTSFTTTKKL